MRRRQIEANNFRLRSIDRARSKLSYPDLGNSDFFRSPSIEEKWQQLEQEQQERQGLISSIKRHLSAKKTRINKILGDRPPDWDGSLRPPGKEPDFPSFSGGGDTTAPVALGGDTPMDLKGGVQAPTSEQVSTEPIETPAPKTGETLQEWVHKNWSKAPDHLKEDIRRNLRDPEAMKRLVQRQQVALSNWRREATRENPVKKLAKTIFNPDAEWRVKAQAWLNDPMHQDWLGDAAFIAQAPLLATSFVGSFGAGKAVGSLGTRAAPKLLTRETPKLLTYKAPKLLTYNAPKAAEETFLYVKKSGKITRDTEMTFREAKKLIKTGKIIGRKIRTEGKTVGYHDYTTGQIDIYAGEGYGPNVNRIAQWAMDYKKRPISPETILKIYP